MKGKNMKTITIVTPTYNRANKLEKAFESLKKQTRKDFEWLVIDDGSTALYDELKEKENIETIKKPEKIKTGM